MSVFEISEIVLNEENEPLVMADGNILCHVVDANGKTDTVGVEPDIVNTVINLRSPGESEVEEEKKEEREDWRDDQTRFILAKYYEYLPEVGPLKRFRLKKNMWAEIAKEMNKTYKSSKTATKVENRYKTVMKRKKKAVDNNGTTGAKRLKVDFEEELKKITSIDDSIEPEVLQDQTNFLKRDKQKLPTDNGKKNKSVLSFLKTMNEEKKTQRESHHREKEENKERRHREKIGSIKTTL